MKNCCLLFSYLLLFIIGQTTAYAGSVVKNTVVANYKRHVTYVDSFPTPKDIDHLLFYIQRDPNTNTICYTLNIDKDGKLDLSNPIHAFWIRYPEGGVKKDLNFIQRKFAYGINTKKLSDGSYDVRSVAYNKLPMRLKKDVKGVFRIYATINNKEAILERIFIRIGDGGTFWNPDVKYIELKGVEVDSGKKTLMRFKP
ncbi:hypothetical protein GCM10023231_38410 [Olivibacter ginsenosidimutans]|uniref:DUF4833 domain-containing protein n=2 Tax=Olivibacter ginsenosidimutans TaxID=1176537 RepID=A0ABP9C8H7_9SPHI